MAPPIEGGGPIFYEGSLRCGFGPTGLGAENARAAILPFGGQINRYNAYGEIKPFATRGDIRARAGG